MSVSVSVSVWSRDQRAFTGRFARALNVEVDVDVKVAAAQRSVRHEAICKRKWRVEWNCNGFLGIGLGLGVALGRREPEYF